MNKLKVFFLILIVLFIVIGLYWFFVLNKNTISNETIISNNPFGTVPDNTKTTPTNTTTNTVPEENKSSPEQVGMVSPGLYKISTDPIAGIAVFDINNLTRIRFVDRATGHIFEKAREGGEITRITNTTIPKIYEALFSSDGKEVILRYLRDDNETIRSFYTKLSASSTPDQEISGSFLEDGIKSISSRGNKIPYTKKSTNGSSIILSNFDGSKATSVFSSSFTNWTPVLTGINVATIYSAPSLNTTGVVYKLSLVDGSYTKIIEGDGVSGLSSPDGKRFLLSGISQNSLFLKIKNKETGEEKSVPSVTFAQKCVWASDSVTIYCGVPKNFPKGSYPDSWYKGETSFEDSLWRIDASTGESVVIADISTVARTTIDLVNPTINNSGTVLTFKDKNSLIGWAYVIK